MRDAILKKIILECILQEMGTKIPGIYNRSTGRMDNIKGHNTVKQVNNAIVAIEDGLTDLEQAIGEHSLGNRKIEQIRKLLDRLNTEYGMDEPDFDTQFTGR